MTTVVLVRRFLADYARNPVNLLVLVLVPVVFVVVAAGSLADAAKLLGGAGGGFAVETTTAGWAAGFLAGIAMYFQTSAARDVDRRLVLSGLSVTRLVAARLAAGLALAVLASGAALLALAARSGIDRPGRVVAGTLMFAIVYLGIGAVVGSLVRNPVNGTVLIMFVWIVDVFFGPTIGANDKVATRGLPTHFVSLWMVGLSSGHGGRPGDLGLALAWTVGAAVLAWTTVVATTRVAHDRRRQRQPGSVGDQLTAAIRAGWRDWRRNPTIWALLIVVPAVYVYLSDAITPHRMTPLVLVEGGRRVTQTWDIADIHAGTMAPIAVASLAALVGLFVAVDTRAGDQRLTLAGLRSPVLLTARLVTVGLAAVLATAVSLAVVAAVFDARQWGVYLAGNLLLAATYGLIGVLLAPIFGRVAGVFIAFLLPFLDLGLTQSPMLHGEPSTWAQALPGYGGTRVLIDGALTDTFDETRALAIAVAWLVVLTIAAVVLFRRAARPAQG